MNYKLAASLVLIFSPASAAPVMPGDLPAVSVTAEMETVIETSVRTRLKDPESAQISHVGAYQDQSGQFVWICGLVNARNSFGGYVGNVPFAATGSRGKDGNFHTSIPVLFQSPDAWRLPLWLDTVPVCKYLAPYL